MWLLTVLFVITVSSETRTEVLQTINALQDKIARDSDFYNALHPKMSPYSNPLPVPFGHIFKEGFEDPRSPIKQPIDLLELRTVYVKNTDNIRDMIKKGLRDYQEVVEGPPERSPEEKQLALELERIPEKNLSRTWNIAAIQQVNAFDPPGRRALDPRARKRIPEGPGRLDKSGFAKFFSSNSYELQKEKRSKNWTTCSEFGRKANFHPNDIVDVDWVPFYVWTDSKGTVRVAKIHKFTYPTKKLVIKYKEEMGAFLNKTLDWESPKLLMREDPMEWLLIAVDRTGLFDAIPYTKMPDSMKGRQLVLPLIQMRLKIVSPYLALMFCDGRYTTIMAESGDEPKLLKDKIAGADTLKYRGRGFPVYRDLEGEMMEARLTSEHRAAKEDQKYIYLDDQMAAARTKMRGRDFRI